MIADPKPGEKVLLYPEPANADKPPILVEYIRTENGWAHVRVPDWDIRYVPGGVGIMPESKRIFVEKRVPQTRIARQSKEVDDV